MQSDAAHARRAHRIDVLTNRNNLECLKWPFMASVGVRVVISVIRYKVVKAKSSPENKSSPHIKSCMQPIAPTVGGAHTRVFLVGMLEFGRQGDDSCQNHCFGGSMRAHRGTSGTGPGYALTRSSEALESIPAHVRRLC